MRLFRGGEAHAPRYRLSGALRPTPTPTRDPQAHTRRSLYAPRIRPDIDTCAARDGLRAGRDADGPSRDADSGAAQGGPRGPGPNAFIFLPFEVALYRGDFVREGLEVEITYTRGGPVRAPGAPAIANRRVGPTRCVPRRYLCLATRQRQW